MPDSLLLPWSGDRITDDDGNPVSGAKVKTYYEGTLTQLTTYTTDALSTPHDWPLEADANGLVPDAYIGTDDYKAILTDAADVTLLTRDNRPGALDTSGFGAEEAIPVTIITGKSANFTVTTADQGTLFKCNSTSASFAATLPSAVGAGNGFRVGIFHNGSANTVAIVPVLGQSIAQPGLAVAYAKALTNFGECMWLVSDGANWTVDTYCPAWLTNTLPFFRVTDRITAPPTNPAAGARYIVNGTATGVWLTQGFAEHAIVEADGNGGWIGYSPTEGTLAFVDDEDLFTAFVGGIWNDQLGMSTPGSSNRKMILVQDQKASGAASGTLTAGSWTAATLNTNVYNGITGASLATNRVTLPAGTYRAMGFTCFSATGGGTPVARARLYNDTAAAAIGYSTPVSAITTDVSETNTGVSAFDLVFTLAVQSVVGIDLRCTSTTARLGEPVSTGDIEVYRSLVIEDLATLQGPTGPQGATGNDGLDAAYYYQWSTSTSGDPLSSKIRGNHATISSVTEIAISYIDANFANLGTAGVITSWDNSTSANKARLKISKQAAEDVFAEFHITGAATDNSTYYTFPVTYIGHGGSLGNGDDLAILVTEKGDKGDTGTAGITGSTSFTFSSTTTDSDPGSGLLRLNHATPASATAIYIDNNNRGGSDVSAWLDTFDDLGGAARRGELYMYDTASALTVFRIYKITGSVTDGTGYRKLTAVHVAGAGSFTNGNEVVLAFLPVGSEGSDIASSVDGTFGFNTTAPLPSASIVRIDEPLGNTTNDTRVTISNSAGNRAALTQSNASNHITMAMGAPGVSVLGDRWGLGMSGSGEYAIIVEHGGYPSAYHKNFGVHVNATSALHPFTVGETETPIVTAASGAIAGVYRAGATYQIFRNTTNNIESFIGSSAASGIVGTASAHALSIYISNAASAVFDGSTLRPNSSGLLTLGSTTVGWNSLFFHTGTKIDWDNGDITVTHSANTLTFAGASSGFLFGNVIAPTSNDGAALGSTVSSWSDMFLASGGVINWNNGAYTATQSSTTLTLSGGLVINEDGNAVNTRIESDTNANMVFVDGTNNRVAIGHASPAVRFDVQSGDSEISRFLTDETLGYVSIYNTNGTNSLIFGGNGSTAFFQNTSGTIIEMQTAGGAVTADVRMGALRINQAASSIGTGAKTISNAADSSTNFGKYFSINLNGTTVYIPCSTVAPT